MANVKISDLTDASTITGSETLEIVQGGNSRKVTVANLRPGLAVLEALTASRTYFVRTDGSDSNTGLVNSAGGAFLTIQKAIDTVASLLIGPHNVTINVADGTYTGGVSVNGPWLGTGAVTLSGNTTTPANCIISRTSATCVSMANGARLNIGGFEFRTTTSGNAFVVGANCVLTVNGAIRFGAIAALGIGFAVGNGGAVVISANMAITAALHNLFQVADFGAVTMAGGFTYTFTGTWAWGSMCVLCTRISIVQGNPTMNISGATITGTRYSVDNNSVIQTYGGGASYFPGSVAGSAGTGGIYA